MNVVLLHGIWNARAWLSPLAARLRAAGLRPRILGYPSVSKSPDAIAPLLAARLAELRPEAIVGHSLGGMLALDVLRRTPTLPVARVVCLGSPLRGSATAATIARRPWTAPALGAAAAFLQRDLGAWDGAAAVGMVAGNVPHGLGRLVAAVDADSDGTVAVAETRLPGLADHCVVAASHSGLVFSEDAARQVVAFLRTGAFVHDDGGIERAAGIG